MTAQTVRFISVITAVQKEQILGTVATISCTITGLRKKLDEVKWTKSDDSQIISGQSGFTIADGGFTGDSQITTLTVDADQNNIDTSYNCLITSNEHAETEKSTAVILKVFSKYIIS